MRTFIYLIGSMDDFESVEDLKTAYFGGERSFVDCNASVFVFKVSDSCGTDSMTVRDIATYIGRGLAFSNDWGMDGTVSTLLEA